MANFPAVYQAVEQLRSEAYLQSIRHFPEDKQQLKHKIYQAFQTMVGLCQQRQFGQVDVLGDQLLSIAPTNPEIYLVMGHLCLELFEDPNNAIRFLSEYAKAHPENISVWSLLCVAYFRADFFPEAQEAGKQALKRDPKSAVVYTTFAQIAHSEHAYEAALEYNRKGLAIDPQDPVLNANLGGILQILGRKEEAEAIYRAALANNPHCYDCYYGLSEVHSIKDEQDPILLQAQEIAHTASETSYGINSLYFALGRMYLQCKKDSAAWEYLHKAHRMMLHDRPNLTGYWDRKCEETVGFFSQQYFQSSHLIRINAHPQAQPVFIVGMPRSGTTLVEQILASHSQVDTKGELRDLGIMTGQIQHLFGTKTEYPEALRQADTTLLQRMADHYNQVLLRDIPLQKRFVIDKSPFNFSRLGLIYQLFPGAKIIHCTRNPMDIALSIYTTKFTSKLGWDGDLTHIANYYTNYRKFMAHWEKTLPMPIHTVSYEGMVADQQGETARLLAYLDVEWEEACLQFHQSNRAVGTASTWQVRQPIYTQSVARWKRHEQELQPFIAGIGEYAAYAPAMQRSSCTEPSLAQSAVHP